MTLNKPTDSGRDSRVLFRHPEAGAIFFEDGALLIEQYLNEHEQLAASLPIGHQGLKLLGLRLLALSVEIELGGAT